MFSPLSNQVRVGFSGLTTNDYIIIPTFTHISGRFQKGGWNIFSSNGGGAWKRL
jgi:hypothetical protein